MLDLLDRLHAAAVQARRDGSVLEIRVLQALAQHARGDLPEALAALSRSFDTPEPESYVRLYLDEGAPMLALLQHAAGSADPVVQARSRRLLEHATASVEATAEPHQTLDGGPLSDRELQVLRLLDSELTGPEIARELYVTLNTLRTHTKRIFTKLDVTTPGSGGAPRPRTRAPLSPLVSHRQSHHVVTRCHPIASYVAYIPAATATDQPDRERT